MNRLECVGKSAAALPKGVEATKPGTLGLGSPAINISVPSQSQEPKPQSCAQGLRTQPLQIPKEPAKVHTSGTEVFAAVLDSASAAATSHGRVQSVEQTAGDGEAHEDPFLDSKEYTHEHEAHMPHCPAEAEQSDEQKFSQNEEEFSQDEDTPRIKAPIELLAEFLKAVMDENYPLAQKLCCMILIYEPENPEAQLFLPLIEERLLIEASDSSCDEDSTEEDEDDENDEECTSSNDGSSASSTSSSDD